MTTNRIPAAKTSPTGRWPNSAPPTPPPPDPKGLPPNRLKLLQTNPSGLRQHSPNGTSSTTSTPCSTTPTYRDTYAANLRRELPRIPFVQPEHFWPFVQAGERLAHIHVHYEDQPQYPLQHEENPDLPLDYRVEKMRLSKDKTSLKYNDFLTLHGIPPQVFDYKLGNRSALDWVIDQYRVKTDKRSGITNDPNNLDDETYILRLIKQVITVSLETVEIVNNLPPLEIIEQR